MNTFSFFHKISLTMALALGFSFAACDSFIYESPGIECEEIQPEPTPRIIEVPENLLKFIYDYNMNFADAFSSSVATVEVFAFDSNNILAFKGVESGWMLSQEDYYFPLDITPGEYTILAWCGAGIEHSFSIFDAIEGISTLSEVNAALRTDAKYVGMAASNSDLDPLFHGLTHIVVEDTPGQHISSIFLTKDTNCVRILLQQLNGESVNADDFDIRIVADNGALNYDNSPIDGNTICYRPWLLNTVGVDAEARSDFENPSAILAELTVNRILADKEMRLIINNANSGENIISIPLNKYALLVKGFYNLEMDNQEYLDRQDNYNLTFFLDEGLNWISSSIIINSWELVVNNKDLS